MRAVPVDAIREVLSALGLRHGSVTVHVHDGEPREVEVSERIRVERPAQREQPPPRAS